MIAALKRTRLYQRYRQARARRRQRSHKGLARSLEQVLVNHDAMLRALTHLVERMAEASGSAERRDRELRTHLQRLEQLLGQQEDRLSRLAGSLDRGPEPAEPGAHR